MCIKDNFNDVLQNGDWYEVSNFMNDCECSDICSGIVKGAGT